MTGCIAIGLGFGDEGKGAICQNLTELHSSTLNVRFSGGPQAAHNVIGPTGVHHCFSQFGSGSMHPNVRTHLSRFMLINPYQMMLEADTLQRKGFGRMFDRLTIDHMAVLITPWHVLLNQIGEVCRGGSRHGSCGQGIGATRAMELQGVAMRPFMLRRPEALVTMELIRRLCINQAADVIMGCRVHGAVTVAAAQSLLDRLTASETAPLLLRFYQDWLSLVHVAAQPAFDGNPVIFEGAQGVLLDEVHGAAPYNTWTNTTFDNALVLCREWNLEPVKIGVMRTYMTRHGAGPFPTEDSRMQWPDCNKEHDWQGKFRQGPLDLVALKYAVEVSRPDCLTVTHMDRVKDQWIYCRSYEGMFKPDMVNGNSLYQCRPVLSYAPPEAVLPIIEHHLGLPVRYTTAGPSPEHFTERVLSVEAVA